MIPPKRQSPAFRRPLQRAVQDRSLQQIQRNLLRQGTPMWCKAAEFGSLSRSCFSCLQTVTYQSLRYHVATLVSLGMLQVPFVGVGFPLCEPSGTKCTPLPLLSCGKSFPHLQTLHRASTSHLVPSHPLLSSPPVRFLPAAVRSGHRPDTIRGALGTSSRKHVH